MTSYYNYYGVEAGTTQNDTIVRSNFTKNPNAFGVEGIFESELGACAEECILLTGIPQEKLAVLKNLKSRMQNKKKRKDNGGIE